MVELWIFLFEHIELLLITLKGLGLGLEFGEDLGFLIGLYSVGLDVGCWRRRS